VTANKYVRVYILYVSQNKLTVTTVTFFEIKKHFRMETLHAMEGFLRKSRLSMVGLLIYRVVERQTFRQVDM
jgi:hypothetical protein